jgi:tight adherence protein B
MTRLLFSLYCFGLGYFCFIWAAGFTGSKRNPSLQRLIARKNISSHNEIALLRCLVLQMLCLVILTVVGLGAHLAFGISLLLLFLPKGIKLTLKKNRQKKLFLQVEPLLMNLGSALYINSSISGAFREVYDATEMPMRAEIALVLTEIEAGLSIKDSLTRLAGRVSDEVLELALDGILICNETGGDLATYITSLAQLKRDRMQLQNKVKAMSSQQKTTAKIVTAIPVIFFALIWLGNKSYADYFNSTLGIIIGVYCLVSIAGGFVVLNKMTSRITVALGEKS